MRQALLLLLLALPAAAADTITGADGTYRIDVVSPGTYTLTPTKLGGQHAISALDATYALQAAVGQRSLSEKQKLACDASGNGTVSALDATYMLQMAVGKIARMPIAVTCGSDFIFWPALASPTPAGVVSVTEPKFEHGVCTMGSITVHVPVTPGVPPPTPAILPGMNFESAIIGDCTGNGP